MEKIIEISSKRKYLILDGAMGTYLEEIGFKGITPEIANITDPEIVERVHYEYCLSGAEIILTNTFGANRVILKRKKLDDKIERIIKRGVEISLRVKRDFENILIAGDIGPTGELLFPYGNFGIKEAEDVFLEVGKIFEQTDVDFLLLETFQDIEELKIAYNTLRENTSFFVIPCLTFNYGKEFRTLMGQTVDDFIKWAEINKIEIIGLNCGINSKEMVELVKIIKELSQISLWVKPNAGKPHFSGGKIEYEEDIDEFSKNCLKIVELGAKFIFGCFFSL